MTWLVVVVAVVIEAAAIVAFCRRRDDNLSAPHPLACATWSPRSVSPKEFRPQPSRIVVGGRTFALDEAAEIVAGEL